MFGGTNQVQPNANGLLAAELGLEFDAGALRFGFLGTLGARRDATAWSFSALLGHAWRQPSGRALELLGELGLQGYSMKDEEQGILETRTVSGGAGNLPYVGGRLAFGNATDGGGFAIGIFVQQTLGSTTERYRVTECSLFTCQVTDRQVRYGGLAVGLFLDGTLTYRPTGRGPAPPAEPGSDTWGPPSKR